MADAKVKLLLDLQDNVSGGLKTAGKNVYSFQKNVEDMQPAFKSMAAIGTASFAAISGAAAYSIKSYQDAERAQRQLEHAVIAVSKGTKEQAQAISDATDALQAKSGIDGDALKMGAAQLSTFGLQTKSVLDLTKSLADLTVNQNGVNASSDQYVQSANVMAKALRGQFGVLEKSGIRFTEAQQSLILYGTEAEKVAALQEGLAQNLRETTDTLDGIDAASARASRSFGEIAESIGAALEPAFLAAMNAITPVINSINEWAAANPQLITQFILIGGGIAALVAAVGLLGMALPPIIAGFTGLGAAIGLLLSPVGLITLAIVAIGAAIIYLWNTNEQFRQIVTEIWAQVQVAITTAIQVIGMWFEQFKMWLADLWTNTESLRANLAIGWAAISELIGAVMVVLQGWFIEFGTWLYDLWIQTEDTRLKLSEIWLAFQTLMTTVFGALWTTVLAFIGNLKKFIQENETVKVILLAAWEVFKTAFGVIFEALKAIVNLFLDVIKGIIETTTAVIKTIQDNWNNFGKWWDGFWKSVGDAVNNTINSIKQWINEMIQAIQNAMNMISNFAMSAAKVGVSVVSGGMIRPRASGGNVNPNQPYLVGERRPEMFVPSGYGRIQPATGGGVTINVSGNAFYGPDDLADTVMATLANQLKQNILVS